MPERHRPPSGRYAERWDGAGNATEDLTTALAEQGVTSVGAARSRNQAARDAIANLRRLEARITGITPASVLLGIEAGAAPLKLFIGGLDERAKGEGSDKAADDVEGKRIAVSDADTEHAKAEDADEAASERLLVLEARNAPLMVLETDAERDVMNAEAQLAAVEGNPGVANLSDALQEAHQLEAGHWSGFRMPSGLRPHMMPP